MPPDRPTPPPSRPGRSEPWRMERVVQRVPAHLGEATTQPVSGWIVIAGIILLLLVTCGVLFILLDLPTRLASFGAVVQPTATRTPRSVTPAVTTIPVTLPPPSPTPGPTAVTVKYTVKAGDTLSSIAAKYKVTIQAIMTANNLKDETIRIGDILVIPLSTPGPTPKSDAQTETAPVAFVATPTLLNALAPSLTAQPAATPGMVRHTVSKGDTLISIAVTYNSTVDGIRIANQLVGDMLSIGQVLNVPVGAWTPTAAPTTLAQAQPTATAQFAYAAPELMSPADGYQILRADNLPTLGWISPAGLKTTEFYVLHIDYTVNGTPQSIVKQVKQGTSYKLVQSDFQGTIPNGTKFSWYIVIVGSNLPPGVRAEANTMQVSAASPPSATRSFTW